MQMIEEWRTYIDGYYEVSNLGNIRTLTRAVKNRKGDPCIRKGIVNKLTPDTKGYLTVQICKEGSRTLTRVHRIVATVFIGPPPEGCVIDHLNGNKQDNRSINLEWVTQHENVQRALKRAYEKRAREKDPFSFFPRVQTKNG